MIDAILLCDRCSMRYRCEGRALRSAIMRRCICGGPMSFGKRQTLRAAIDSLPQSVGLDQVIGIVESLEKHLRAVGPPI